jgi:hypothetical protein
MLIPHPFFVQPGQDLKIRRALQQSKGCRIQVKKGGQGGHQLLVTPSHVEKYRKAAHGTVVSLPFKHDELRKNHRGGFLPLLAAALAPVIGGVAGGLIEKGIAGSGIRGWKKKKKGSTSGCGNKIFTVKKHGSGMILNPWKGTTGGGGSGRQNLYSLQKHGGSGMVLNPWPAGHHR